MKVGGVAFDNQLRTVHSQRRRERRGADFVFSAFELDFPLKTVWH